MGWKARNTVVVEPTGSERFKDGDPALFDKDEVDDSEDDGAGSRSASHHTSRGRRGHGGHGGHGVAAGAASLTFLVVSRPEHDLVA